MLHGISKGEENMSVIGEFGLIEKRSFDLLLNAIEHNVDEVGDCINAIIKEAESSRDLMVNDECSGEVYLAMFEYIEQKRGIDIRGQTNYGERWREVTEDYDVIIMTEEIKKQLNIGSVDDSAFSDFLNDFYQMDFEEIARIALKSFASNLEILSSESALVFRLY